VSGEIGGIDEGNPKKENMFPRVNVQSLGKRLDMLEKDYQKMKDEKEVDKVNAYAKCSHNE